MCWLAAIGLVVYGIGNQLDDSRKNCLTTGNLDGQKPSSTPAAKARPLSQEPSAVSHRKRRASMTGEALEAFRAASAERQRNRRARLRAEGLNQQGKPFNPDSEVRALKPSERAQFFCTLSQLRRSWI
jgi:hypothetical protein